MSYTEKDAAELSGKLNDVMGLDVRDAPSDMKIKALQSLVKALETGLKIAYERHYENAAEPYPGGCKTTIEQCRAAIAVARSGGLIP